MKQVLETKIIKPSEVNGDVPVDFDKIVMKALERDPAQRYATAKQMAHDLEEVLREHKYGGRNDVIAKYMQATFESHITARKKLLQEVSSKGRASADILEAAFNEPLLASGSPVTNSGEFSVKFRQPSSEMAAMTGADDSGTRRVRQESSQLSIRAHSPSQLLSPLPRSARPSGQLLSQSPEPEVVLPGGGTTANNPADRTKLYVILGVVALVVVAIVIVAIFSGGPKVKDEGVPHGTTGSAEPVGSAKVAAPPDAASATPDASVAEVGSGSAATGSAALVAAGSGSGSGSADVDEGEVEIEMPATGSGGTTSSNPNPVKPVRVSAQELFKTGMQSFVKGDSRTAVVSFRRAVQAQPGYATAWRALGLAHEKLGEWGQAKTALQRYLQLAPNAPDAAQIRQRIGGL